ncbi:MAG: hypothetical protein ACK5QX_10210, partial [bacterium]
PYALALQKLCNGIEVALQELKKHDIFGVIDGQIVIDFLDEQLSERGQVSEKRRNAAQKRWNDASALQVQSKSNANRIEENRIEEKKKEEKIITASKLATIETREIEFRDKLIPYIDTYGKEMLRAFYDYWTEKNEGGKKMKFEMQRVFEIEKRLRTWSNNNFQKNGKSNGTPKTFDKDKLTRLINERYGITGTTE